jgi:DDE superfamily endonuclease
VAVRGAKKVGHAYVVLDGTVIPVDRVAADRPFYSGKHRRHGMNLQVIASPGGDILWVSAALAGPCMTRRTSGSGASWPNWRPAGLDTLVDKGYQGSS